MIVPNILREQNELGESDNIPIQEFTLKSYNCGLCAGGTVRLRKDVSIVDDERKSTGRVYSFGEIWEVLTGSEQDPKVL
jgi:hypothetical protein